MMHNYTHIEAEAHRAAANQVAAHVTPEGPDHDRVASFSHPFRRT
jgi:hypothetical protein